MKKTLIIVLMLVLSMTVISAQDDDDDCVIDLSSAASLIVEAQAQASRGDSEGAIRSMTLAQEVLDNAIRRCGGEATMSEDTADEPVTVDTSIIPETEFTISNETFNFAYPEGWLTETASTFPTGGIVLLASNTRALDESGNDTPDLGEDDYVVGLIVGEPEALETTLRQGASLDDVIAAFNNQLASQDTTETGEITSQTINDREARLFTMTGETFAGVVVAVELDDDRFGAAVGLSSLEAQATIQDITVAILESLEYR